MGGIIFFLQYWDANNPTLADLTGFMLGEMVEEDECQAIGGKAFTSHDYYGSDPKEVITKAIKRERPKWVIGIENTATILLSYKRQRKILVNPTVTLNDLNWVTPETIRDTYAFFSADYEADYEMYSRVYRNVAFYPAQKRLYISDLAPIIKSIVDEPTIH